MLLKVLQEQSAVVQRQPKELGLFALALRGVGATLGAGDSLQHLPTGTRALPFFVFRRKIPCADMERAPS